MQDRTQKSDRYADVFKKTLPILSFIIPLIILYFFGSIGSGETLEVGPLVFEKSWKGRIFYVFFLWLVSMELILGWEKIQSKLTRVFSARTIAFVLVLLLPTIYVVAANFYGLNSIIVDLAASRNLLLASWVPLSTEYMVFTMLFTLIVLLGFGTKGLKSCLISVFFLGIIGMVYTIDNIYPRGSFTPFQIIVPTTTTLATYVLGLIGYHTRWLGVSEGMPILVASGPHGVSHAIAIAWPCSGVESLLLYGVTILLFLKDSVFSWRQRTVYFIIGAVVTYFINILRIVTIFVIDANHGDFMAFHDYYGQLYSITWIVTYPLLIIGSLMLWSKIRDWRAGRPVVQV
jgi:exosortase/archaeosortase family protein